MFRNFEINCKSMILSKNIQAYLRQCNFVGVYLSGFSFFNPLLYVFPQYANPFQIYVYHAISLKLFVTQIFWQIDAVMQLKYVPYILKSISKLNHYLHRFNSKINPTGMQYHVLVPHLFLFIHKKGSSLRKFQQASRKIFTYPMSCLQIEFLRKDLFIAILTFIACCILSHIISIQ